MTAVRADTLSFFVPGVPAPQGSKKFIGKGRMVESSKKVAPWRKAVASVGPAVMRAAPMTPGNFPLAGPLQVEFRFVLPRTKAMRQRQAVKADACKYPDLDKLCRSTLDGLVMAEMIEDDSHVTALWGSKQIAAPSESTGVHITVTRL